MKWMQLLSRAVESPDGLAGFSPDDIATMRRVSMHYPMRINPYWMDLINGMDVLGRQVIPDIRELHDNQGMTDPLAEDRDSPVPLVTHRYPDRVLFLVSGECAIYCRFCTRKRKIGRFGVISDAMIQDGIRYIECQARIRDVLLSGGDPLLLSDDRLDWILGQIRRIAHVDVIRIGTRVPSSLPQRITHALVRMISKHQPVFMHVHFNHPKEMTPAAEKACRLLADGGIPLGSQTVLLRGINDSPETMESLFRILVKSRIRPYYLLQADLTRGTNHFRTSLQTGMDIMKYLRGRVSGLAVPNYIVDLPGGGGKVPVLPAYYAGRDGKDHVFRNYRNKLYKYPDPVLNTPEH